MRPAASLRSCFLLILVSLSVWAYAEMSAIELAAAEDLRVEWDPFRRVGVLRDGRDRLSFDPVRGVLVLNYTSVIGRGGVAFRDGVVVFSDEAVEYVRELFEHAGSVTGAHVAAIVLDPGHGGRDPGASHAHVINGERIELIEKDIVLQVARELYSLLAARYPDRTLLLTRDEDVYLKLEERVRIANEISIDPATEIMIFVSIHANASLNPTTFGYEVWYLPPEYGRTNLVSTDEVGAEASSVLPILNLMRDDEYTSESITLARTILESFDRSVGEQSRDLGLKEESWFVVRNAKMPSILVELGYLTNPEEAAKMADPEYLRKLTVGLYNGIARYIEDFETRYRTME